MSLQLVNRLDNILIDLRRIVKRIGYDFEIKANGDIYLDGAQQDEGDIRGIAINLLELDQTESKPG